MGVKLNLTDPVSGFNSAAALIANNTALETAFNKALDRTGSADNAMLVDLDMGLNKVINVTTDLDNLQCAVNVATLNERQALNDQILADTLAARDITVSSKDIAVTSAASAKNSKEMAHKWAENDLNVEVIPGEYSAKHWAMKAKGSSGAWSPDPSTNPWVFITEADRDFINKWVNAEAIDATKIGKITAGQIVTGTLAATEKVSVEGQVESLYNLIRATLGPMTVNGKTAVLSVIDDVTPVFAVYEDGSAEFTGKITISEGSGYNNLTDRPYSLSDISPAEAQQIQDALLAASTAQETADGKIESFYQVDKPTNGKIGDLWFDTDDGNKLYRHDGTDFVPAQDTGISLAVQAAATAQSTADGKITTFFDTTAPSGASEGDLWYDSSTKQLKRYNGSSWVMVSTAVTKTSELEDDAGLGSGGSSSWEDIENIPPRFGDTDTPSSPGLYLTNTHLGYHNGNGAVSGWNSYIQNDGQFHFGGVGNNYIDWNGATLAVRGDVHATSIAASASISSPTISGGSVSGASIYGNTITGGTISGTTITGTTISGNTISGGTISGTNVSGSTITGGYVQTNDNNSKRIVMDGNTNDLQFYNNWGLYARVGLTHVGTQGDGYATGYFYSPGGSGVYGTGGPVGVEGLGNLVGGHFTCNYGGSLGQGVYGAHLNSGVGGSFVSNYGIGLKGTGGDRGVQGYGGNYDFYASGPGANYGPFTGSHDTLLEVSASVTPGDILSVSSVYARSSVSNIIAKVALSSTEEDKKAFGVFVLSRNLPLEEETEETDRPAALKFVPNTDYENLRQTHCWAIVNGVGEGQINVCSEAGDIEAGDFICTSNVPGKGKRYDGSDMRVVVAKALEPVIWANEQETVKQIACVYMCG